MHTPEMLSYDVEEANFDELVVARSNERPILLDIGAEWCAPCKVLTPRLEKLVQDPELHRQNEEMKRDFQIVLAGMTMRDIAWQEKVLDKILTETGGYKASLMEEPDVKN